LINVGVVGGTGYTCVELLRLLSVKGAADMNLMYGFPETRALDQLAVVP